ncbi:LysR family transcriptional regulator [Thiotrichales bacterium 19S9-12]|nr:LysR family transcriptional regulator [Thiotrichales bacterium 19S9-11]MCF6812003.1 LysR family transcriptional regulator [Thiotrichales bacterium 19S9-12]
MKERKLSLSNFETYLVVANLLSFTKAAKQLGISKAAISHAIKSLEDEFGLPLFIRTTRKISLTTEGELLLDQCQKLNQALDNTRSLAQKFHNNPIGKLKIMSNATLAEKYLLPCLLIYRKKFPNVSIEILIEERRPNLLEEDIDLVFGVNWPAPNDVIRRKVGETRYILCASPKYLKIHGEPQSISELKNHNYIPHSGREEHTPVIGLKKSLQPNILSNLSSNNIEFIKACVLNGIGIAQFHEYNVIKDIKSGMLKALVIHEFNDILPLYIYYKKNRFVLPKVRQLVNIILDDSNPVDLN